MQNEWTEVEMATADLGDEWLNRRLQTVLNRLDDDPAASIPMACRGWAEVQATYRFLDPGQATWEAVLELRWACTPERMSTHAVVLVRDTTELDFTSQPGLEGTVRDDLCPQ